jgi:hypothetical protein
LVEILLLSGGTPYANFEHLAHAWGREKGFHSALANSICERRGIVDRKKRSDTGRSRSGQERDGNDVRSRNTTNHQNRPIKSENNMPSGTSGMNTEEREQMYRRHFLPHNYHHVHHHDHHHNIHHDVYHHVGNHTHNEPHHPTESTAQTPTALSNSNDHVNCSDEPTDVKDV